MRQKLMDIFRKNAEECGCKVYIRRNIASQPLKKSEMPCIILNDGLTAIKEVLPYGDGNWCRWAMKLNVNTISAKEEEAAKLLSNIAHKLQSAKDEAEVSSIKMKSHNFSITDDPTRTSVASMQLEVSFVGGPWEI